MPKNPDCKIILNFLRPLYHNACSFLFYKLLISLNTTYAKAKHSLYIPHNPTFSQVIS